MSVSCRRWRADEGTAKRLVDRIIFLVGKEEDLVFPDGATHLTAETVIVKAGIDEIRSGLSARDLDVNGVQIAVLEILIQTAMPLVGAADDGLVKLTAGGVTKFRRELVLQNGKVLDRIVRDGDQRAGNSLLLLSTPSMVKLLLRGRWPETEGPVPAPIPPLVATPAFNNERLRTPKPIVAVGRS